MFIQVLSRAQHISAAYRLSLFQSLLPMASVLFLGTVCVSAQTGVGFVGNGYSSSIDQIRLAPGLTASALSQPSLPSYDAAPGNPQNASGERPAGSSHQTDFKKFSFEAGFGANMPAGGNTGTYQTTSLGLQVGVARNLNPLFGAQLEYDANFFGIPSSVISTYCNACSDGYVIVQSVTLNPYLSFNSRGRTGMYLIGGGGIYFKGTTFLVPTGDEVCNPVTGCILTESVAGHWTNTAFGVNGGGGITWRFRPESSAKLFVEGRYVWIDNQASSSNASSAYPPANYQTSFAPFMVGIRF